MFSRRSFMQFGAALPFLPSLLEKIRLGKTPIAGFDELFEEVIQEVKPGHIITISGSCGSGKTILLKHIFSKSTRKFLVNDYDFRFPPLKYHNVRSFQSFWDWKHKLNYSTQYEPYWLLRNKYFDAFVHETMLLDRIGIFLWTDKKDCFGCSNAVAFRSDCILETSYIPSHVNVFVRKSRYSASHKTFKVFNR